METLVEHDGYFVIQMDHLGKRIDLFTVTHKEHIAKNKENSFLCADKETAKKLAEYIFEQISKPSLLCWDTSQIRRFVGGTFRIKEIIGDLEDVKKEAIELLNTINREKTFAFMYGPKNRITIGNVARVVETCDINLLTAHVYDKDKYKLVIVYPE